MSSRQSWSAGGGAHVVDARGHAQNVARSQRRGGGGILALDPMDRGSLDDDHPFIVCAACMGDWKPAGIRSSAPYGTLAGSPHSAAIVVPDGLWGSTGRHGRPPASAVATDAASMTPPLIRAPEPVRPGVSPSPAAWPVLGRTLDRLGPDDRWVTWIQREDLSPRAPSPCRRADPDPFTPHGPSPRSPGTGSPDPAHPPRAQPRRACAGPLVRRIVRLARENSLGAKAVRRIRLAPRRQAAGMPTRPEQPTQPLQEASHRPVRCLDPPQRHGSGAAPPELPSQALSLGLPVEVGDPLADHRLCPASRRNVVVHCRSLSDDPSGRLVASRSHGGPGAAPAIDGPTAFLRPPG